MLIAQERLKLGTFKLDAHVSRDSPDMIPDSLVQIVVQHSPW